MDDFNELAKVWDDKPRRVNMAKVIANEIVKKVPNLTKMTGLDCGCGTGLLSFNLYNNLKHITLADNSSGMLKVLKEKITKFKISNMTPVNIDLSNDPVFDNSFDIIYSSMVLHHIDNIEDLLNTFYKFLNSSGYICIADLSKEDGSFHECEFNVHKGFEKDSLVNMLKKSGFNNINWDICYEVKKQIKNGEEKSFPVFFVTAQK
ncbi:MAG: methyltransferase domain-containing protein [Clostridiales bacterium]